MKNRCDLLGAVLLVAGTLALAGCGTVQPTGHGLPEQVALEPALEPAPVLALPAQALGCTFAVQQRLTVFAPQQKPQTLDAMLEVDASMVRLALFHMGQRMGTLMWDGQQLHADLSRWWPDVLKPAQVLSDMQLALWPLDVVQLALPEGWEIEENNSWRRLLYKRERRILIQKINVNTLEITYAPAGWRLRIESADDTQPCAAEGQSA